MEAMQNSLAHAIKTQPKNEESEIFKIESTHQQNDALVHCKNCEFLTFSQELLASHNCSVLEERILCPGYFLCKNSFTSRDSLRVHLQIDHKVSENELEKFLTSDGQSQKIQIVDCQLLKKSDSSDLEGSNKSKSKIFIKDVTLLRKPDLPNTHINLPNIFDSLDLTTTDDDIFDDFLATDNEPDFDFEDFEEPTINNEQDDEIIAIPETTQSGKIFVRKNLCSDAIEEAESVKVKGAQNKIYVRSHESLTSQVITTDVVQQPSESSTPDCVIVSSEIIKEPPAPNKIFIRNIETLTNPQAQDALVTTQYFDASEANTSANYLTHPNYVNVNAFTPSIYVRSYDSLVSDTAASGATATGASTNATDSSNQQRCKISIKNMETLIEPQHLMHPPDIFGGHPQNLVIHMRPNQTTDESLIGYRDTSVTPDTLPGSSNVSTCGGNDNDVIILDELNEASFTSFVDPTIAQVDGESSLLVVNAPEEAKVAEEVPSVIETNVENVENPERNQTPNDKPKISEIAVGESKENAEDQPMTRIPLEMANENETETVAEQQQEAPPRKKMKIIKIIRVKKNSSLDTTNGSAEQADPLETVQVVFKCKIADCSLSFSNAKLLNYHKRCHLNDSQIVCPECNSEDFKNFNTLHTHLWRQHTIDMDLFACKLCSFKTPILSRLKNFHEKIHSDEKNYKCEFANCKKRFCNSKQLKNHSQIHKAAKTKSKSAQQPTSATSSDKEDTKKIRCQICNKGFESESGHYIHSKLHKNDEKRFVCEEKSCQYSTNDHNSFRRHKFQHSKARMYACPACDYTSIQSNTYRKHLEKQHKELAEELLYKCGSCKFITISKSKFEGHVSKHLVDA